MLGLSLLAGLALGLEAERPAARPCNTAEITELTRNTDQPYALTCQARLSPEQAITRPIVIQGAEASGAGLDCQGGRIGRPELQVTTRQPTVAIWSRRRSAVDWSAPTDISLKNCTIYGAVRIWGMGSDGLYEDLTVSSRTAQHTAIAQEAAPRRILLDQLAIVANGTIPLYIGPGVTEVSLRRSRISGRTTATALYLDAESARNQILDNRFAVETGREIIAVDGSAHNRIVGNQFELGGKGGIFLYRNCGERGVIRHQTPSNNVITDNVFSGASWLRPRLIVVGAREGRRSYCGEDAGYPFGSSIDDGDRAENNLLARNRQN